MELKTVGLTKKFGSKIAVDDLNITLANGVYGLLGANGAGKTTLMRLLCNIQNPTSGKILLNGKNAVGLGERYRSLLGYLPQHFGYYPDFSAFDFLLYVSALKGLDEKAARKKSKELLEAVLAPGAHSQFGSGKNTQFEPEQRANPFENVFSKTAVFPPPAIAETYL